MSLIFKNFYNLMKYTINIFIGVSGQCKIFLDKSCSPPSAEHRYVCGLGK